MATANSPDLVLRGGRVLQPDGATIEADVVCRGSLIAGVRGRETTATDDTAARAIVDASDALVLPGIVDIHGDGFERTLMPRPGVFVSMASAVSETRSHLLAAGITTAFVSATDGWEPGQRSRATLRELVDALSDPAEANRAPRLLLHVRHERCNTADHDELVGWVDDGTIRMLSYNDHTPGGIAMVKGLSDLSVKRSGVDRDTLEALQTDAVSRRDIGRAQERELADAARTAGIATASHDASDADDLARDLDLGVGIAEFPLSISLAEIYREAGIQICLGAPNLVRGHSHLGNLSVRDAWDAGVADIICSDYHYQSLLQAPFTLVTRGVSLLDAWDAVSRTPAEAAGLDDRGRIEAGALADLLVVEPPTERQPARVRAVIVDGQLAMMSP